MGNEIKDVESRLKKRRTLIIAGIALLIVGSVALGFFWNFYSFFKETSKVRQEQVKIEEKPVSRFREKDWKEVMSVRVRKTEERLVKLEEKLGRIEKMLERIEEKTSKPSSTLPPPRITVMTGGKKEEKVFLPPPPPPPSRPASLESRKPLVSPPKAQVKKKQPEVLREFKPEKKPEEKKESKARKTRKKRKIALPMGFTKALLLSGLDAPTLQYGRNNPHPVFALLMDRTVLANNRDLNLKGCFVLGSAYGELSSERAYIRLTKISCIDRDGKVYSQNVKGWVFGSDGKPGIRGRLVTRFGSVLAKTFIAGTLEGISNILQATNTTVAISPIGTTSTIKPEDATKVAVASGFGQAASRLADFYIKLASEYFPVIEIPPGKAVTVVFEGGEEVEEGAEIRNPDPLNSSDSGSGSRGSEKGGKAGEGGR